MLLIKKNTFFSIMLLVFLVLTTQSNMILQFISIFTFGIINLVMFGHKIRYSFRWVFYIGLIFLSLIQVSFFLIEDYSLNYIINTLISTAFLFFAFLCSEFIIKIINNLDKVFVKKVITNFFVLNSIIVLIQYILIAIEANNIIPYASHKYSLGMSSGDYIKGFFSNSSVNMIICSFYTVYFFIEKKKIFFFISFLIVMLTTYMSGILLFLIAISLFVFFTFPIKTKIKAVLVIMFISYLFYIVSPENISYSLSILTEKTKSKSDPVRKFVSFNQTFNYWIKNPKNFIFGAGGGKFSSRTAFVTGGEYVNWYPKKYTYKSKEFNENHFLLWNKKILSIGYKDGTSNQPFSFYNKILGEYGLLGVFLFILYLYRPLKSYKKLTYGKIILLSMLFYFVLDYWFEYFSVIIFFEIFMYLDLKNEKDTIKQ